MLLTYNRRWCYDQVKTAFTDFGKAQMRLKSLLLNIEFETCETTMLPNEYVTLTDPEEIEAFHKLNGYAQ